MGFRDNGKESGNYYSRIGFIGVYRRYITAYMSYRFRILGFWGLGFRGLGFRGLGIRLGIGDFGIKVLV